MPPHSSPDPSSPSLRAKIIGLGERSIRKSYYPELQKKLQTISQMNELLERRVEERTAELKRLSQALEQRAGQLRALACELTEAEERERHRLAQVLHDHLQQILVAAKLRLDRLARRVREEPINQSLRQTAELLDQALAESRSLTAELSPPVLYDAGLTAGLDWLARQMQARHGLTVHLEIDAEAVQVAKDIAVFLFQAIRELLFNVVKHAQADSAQVRMTQSSPTKVQIVVSDQGIGFDPAELEHREVAEGFGLFSIRERVSFLGGRFHIDSAPGRGTRMVIEVPLPHRVPSQAIMQSPEQLKPPLLTIPRQTAERLVHASPARHARPIRVLLADDHPVLRKGLADLLREHLDIDVVAEASDGEEAIDLAHQTNPDVILMDVTMPRMDGVEATRRITAALPEVRVIGLSMHEKSDMAHAMYEAGACLYLNKSTPGDDLTAAIRDQVFAPAPCGKAAR